MKNLRISCGVYQDLIPLIQDHVASEDSIAFVEEHMASCKECRQLFENCGSADNGQIDKKVISNIRRHFYLAGVLVLVAGALLGVFMTNSMGMFYNFGIMPLIGATAYFTLKRRWWIAPLAVTGLTFLWTSILMLKEGVDAFNPSCIVYSIIYAGLCLAGVATAALLHFAFGKEKN